MLILFSLFLLWPSQAYKITEIKVNHHSTLGLTEQFTAFHFKLNYQRTSLSFLCHSGIANIRWSDKKYKDLGASTFEKCETDAIVCGKSTGCEDTHLIVGACLDDFYVYVDSSVLAAMTFVSEYVGGTCDAIKEDAYSLCGAMNYQECDVCGDSCQLAKCLSKTTHIEEYQVATHLCLPTSVFSAEINERCRDFYNVEKGEWKEDCDDSIHIQTVGWGTIVLLVVLMFAFISFFISVVYYNWRLRTTGNPPVKCSKCCPIILFPRPRTPSLSSDYRPPEYYSSL